MDMSRERRRYGGGKRDGYEQGEEKIWWGAVNDLTLGPDGTRVSMCFRATNPGFFVWFLNVRVNN